MSWKLEWLFKKGKHLIIEKYKNVVFEDEYHDLKKYKFFHVA